jgi:hypothetical protein
MADLEYVPQASLDLLGWNLPLMEMPNPANLAAAPFGHEWVTYQVVNLANAPIGFGGVKVFLK